MSIVPTARGFTMACNRDERRTRPIAEAPRRWRVDGIDVTCPIDPASGGTWIAVNDAGVAFALLNRTPVVADVTACADDDRRCGGGLRSRGEIVPFLISACGVSELRRRVSMLDPASYAPFQIVAVCRKQMFVTVSDGNLVHRSTHGLTRPVAFTSSSLGDARAEYLRLPLFDSLVTRSADRLAGQRRFHDHRWPDCPALSVRMRRVDAYTVSRSVVSVEDDAVRLDYEPLPPV